jgi:hypothetical protein
MSICRVSSMEMWGHSRTVNKKQLSFIKTNPSTEDVGVCKYMYKVLSKAWE